ncbi:MAG: universal stress protein [Solirubrobacteraceae bacterium]|jgi:nucleotide-binding universal stress UspA family protein
MPTNIIVSFDGTENDHDALAFGRILGDAGAKVSLAYVRHAHETDAVRERDAQANAEQILERGAEWLAHPEIERHVVVNASTSDGLRALAESENADLLVFGSDWHTAPGHVQPLTSALHLLEDGPVAIAIAAAGLRDRSDARLERIALPGGEVDPAARKTAETLTARAGTPLALPTQEGVDLLVVGSRPGAAEGRVSLSSASEYLVETTTASVLVLPRGVAFDIEQGTAARTSSRSHSVKA